MSSICWYMWYRVNPWCSSSLYFLLWSFHKLQFSRAWTATLTFHAGFTETAATLPRSLGQLSCSYLHIYSALTMPNFLPGIPIPLSVKAAHQPSTAHGFADFTYNLSYSNFSHKVAIKSFYLFRDPCIEKILRAQVSILWSFWFIYSSLNNQENTRHWYSFPSLR